MERIKYIKIKNLFRQTHELEIFDVWFGTTNIL